MDDQGRQRQLSEDVDKFVATVKEQFFCQIRAKNWRGWLQIAAVSALLLSYSVTALAADFVYVAHSAGLDRLRIGPDGSLINLGVVSSSSRPLSITTDGLRFLWEVDFDGTIKSFQINRVTGELKPGQSVKLALATGALAATRDRKYVYAASAAFASPPLDYHALVRYKVNLVTGELTEPLVTQLKGYIVAPTALEVDCNGGALYVANAVDAPNGIVAVYALDPNNGIPTFRNYVLAGRSPSSLATDRECKNVYAMATDNFIWQFATQASGDLVGFAPPNVNNKVQPSAMAFTSDGRIAITANYSVGTAATNAVSLFSRDQTGGGALKLERRLVEGSRMLQ